MRRLATSVIIGAFALGLPLLAAARNGDIDKINGAVRIEAGQQAENVSTVNGALHIGSGASVYKASTVNGSVTLGEKAQASEVGTVNGAISLGGDSHVSGEVSAVNGSIRLAHGADIGGKLSNVNGTIVLDDAHVAGGISTVNGDITVGAGSRIEGGILIEKSSSWFNWNSRKPLIVIGPHAVVQGTLDFRREVVLKVSDSAQIGPVKGATVVKFSGANP
jgi:acyl-[acyl carrier protein]--UDP-N-acetylglucosamine O-acyltransferase